MHYGNKKGLNSAYYIHVNTKMVAIILLNSTSNDLTYSTIKLYLRYNKYIILSSPINFLVYKIGGVNYG